MPADLLGGTTLGIRLPNSGPFAEPEALLETADLAEQLGFDRVWVHDHLSWPREKLTHFATGSLEACEDQDPNFFESVTTASLLAGRRLIFVGKGFASMQRTTGDQGAASRVPSAGRPPAPLRVRGEQGLPQRWQQHA